MTRARSPSARGAAPPCHCHRGPPDVSPRAYRLNSGARRAAAHLSRLGHPDVAVMTGGILAWIDRVDPTLPPY